jgi:hypothetical protein
MVGFRVDFSAITFGTHCACVIFRRSFDFESGCGMDVARKEDSEIRRWQPDRTLRSLVPLFGRVLCVARSNHRGFGRGEFIGGKGSAPAQLGLQDFLGRRYRIGEPRFSQDRGFGQHCDHALGGANRHVSFRSLRFSAAGSDLDDGSLAFRQRSRLVLCSAIDALPHAGQVGALCILGR